MEYSEKLDEQKPVDDWVSLAYTELRRLARNCKKNDQGMTLNPTALVHEAWLVMRDKGVLSRVQFYAYVSTAMRRLLVDAARRRKAKKRTFVEMPGYSEPVPVEQLLSLYRALDELDEKYQEAALIASMLNIEGYTLDQIAERLEMKLYDVRRHWEFAKSFLASRMKGPVKGAAGGV